MGFSRQVWYGLGMTRYHATVTPADVEFVEVTNFRAGDVRVDFTAIGKDIVIPPTATQLRRKRTRYTPITKLERDVTERGVEIIVANDGECSTMAGINPMTGLHVQLWRVKRDLLHDSSNL